MCRRATRLAIGVLNWMSLGMDSSTACVRLRSAPSASQRDVWRRIEARISVFLRLAPVVGSGLGRAVFKLGAIDQTIAFLSEKAAAFAHSFGEYAPGQASTRPRRDERYVLRATVRIAFTVAVPVSAGRMKFESRPSFVATPYLDDPMP